MDVRKVDGPVVPKRLDLLAILKRWWKLVALLGGLAVVLFATSAVAFVALIWSVSHTSDRGQAIAARPQDQAASQPGAGNGSGPQQGAGAPGPGAGGAAIGQPGAAKILPGPEAVPAFLVTSKTRQVYRIHLSGLHPADARTISNVLIPIIGRLPADNPLRGAMPLLKDAASFEEEYRSVRSHLLAAGADTIYFVAEGDWVVTPELPGAIAIAGTAASRDRLADGLRAAGHTGLADYVTAFQPAAGAGGWLVRGQVRAPADARRAQLVHHALTAGCPLRRASVSAGERPIPDVRGTWPITVVQLERNAIDRVVGPVLAQLVPGAAQMAAYLDRAEAITVAMNLVPMPFTCQFAHTSSEQEAEELARATARTFNAVFNQFPDDGDFPTAAAKALVKSTIQVTCHGKDVLTLMKPPALFDLFMAHQGQERMRKLDWTALPAPAGYQWELVAQAGTTSRHDVLGRVAAIKVRGAPGGQAGPTQRTVAGSLFRIAIGANRSLALTIDARGKLTIDLPRPDKGAGMLPAVELFDRDGERVAVVRLDIDEGDPRIRLGRTMALIRQRHQVKVETAQRASGELSDLENQQQKLKLQGVAVDRKLWDEKIREKRAVVEEETRAINLLQELEHKITGEQQQFPIVSLVPIAGASATRVHPLVAMQPEFPFAGEWLWGNGLLTLYQDKEGLVAGTFAIGNKSPGASAKMAIIGGQANGKVLVFTLTYAKEPVTWPRISTTSRAYTGRIVLDDRGFAGRSVIDGQAGNGRIDRLDGAFPKKAWFQDVGTGAFEGYWVHSNKSLNSIFERKSPGAFVGTSGSGGPVGMNKLVGSAAGNLMFVIQSPGSYATIREVALSVDGQKLTFDPLPEGAPKFPLSPRSVELMRSK